MNKKELIEFRKKLNIVIIKIEEVLSALDIECTKYCNFPRLFTSNSFYFVLIILEFIYGKKKELPIFDYDFTFLAGKSSTKENIKNRLRGYRNVIKDNRLAKKNFLVIQDGYEVNVLKKYMKDYRFINASFYPKNLVHINTQKINYISIAQIVSNKLDYSEIINFLYDYACKVISIIDHLTLYYEQEIERIEPKALLYSIGSLTLPQELYAHIANKKGIPVFFFRHSDERRYCDSWQKKYFEDNTPIDALRFDTETYGSMRLDEYRKNKITNKKKKDILYVANVTSYVKDLISFPSAKMQMDSRFEVISAVSKSNLNMDIAVYPVDKEKQYKFYKSITEGIKNINVIKNCKIENIMDQYKVIIISYPQANAAQHALVSNAKVVFYLKDTSVINNYELLRDLEVEIIESKEVLEAFLYTYKFSFDNKRINSLINGKYGKPVEEIIKTMREII